MKKKNLIQCFHFMCTFNFFVVFICVYLKILLKEKLNFTLLLSWLSKLSPSMTNLQEPPLCIIHSVLMMSKVSSRWVPRMFTPEQKACRQQFSEENLDMLRANPENFSRIIIRDKTWVHHHDPETKQESMQWKHKESLTSKKFRVQQSAGKIMATVF